MGIDDNDEFYEEFEEQPTEPEGSEELNTETQDQSEGDYLDLFLKANGIEDRSKIKFENEEGEVEEVDWDSLDNEEKFNLLRSSISSPETDLDESEIELINTIRNSKMSPYEYLQYVGKSSVDTYLNNMQQPQQYTVDQYSDDELFIADFIARMGNITDDEAQDALQAAKSNEELFTKLMGAIRNEYKQQELEIARLAQLEQDQQAQEQFNWFATSVADQISGFTEFQGYDLNMEQADMQLLYDFITGVDAAGNNHFAKALADPKTLVRTAYLALNGELMVDDITEYFKDQITQARKEGYKKGEADALKKMNKPDIVYKTKGSSKSDYFDDLD